MSRCFCLSMDSSDTFFPHGPCSGDTFCGLASDIFQPRPMTLFRAIRFAFWTFWSVPDTLFPQIWRHFFKNSKIQSETLFRQGRGHGKPVGVWKNTTDMSETLATAPDGVKPRKKSNTLEINVDQVLFQKVYFGRFLGVIPRGS